MDFCRQQMRIKAIFIVCKSRLIGTAIIHTRAVELAGWASPAAAQLRSDGTTQTDRQTDKQTDRRTGAWRDRRQRDAVRLRTGSCTEGLFGARRHRDSFGGPAALLLASPLLPRRRGTGGRHLPAPSDLERGRSLGSAWVFGAGIKRGGRGTARHS